MLYSAVPGLALAFNQLETQQHVAPAVALAPVLSTGINCLLFPSYHVRGQVRTVLYPGTCMDVGTSMADVT